MTNHVAGVNVQVASESSSIPTPKQTVPTPEVPVQPVQVQPVQIQVIGQQHIHG